VLDAPRPLTFLTGRGTERADVVDLGQGRRGVVDVGERWVIEPGQAARAAPSLGAPVLEAWAVADGLGGGYLFVLPDGVAFASTFDGAAKRVWSGVHVSFVGPHFVVLSDGAAHTYGLPDGAPIPNGPTIGRGASHPAGFAVVETPAGKTMYTRDGRAFLTLPFVRPRVIAVAPGDAIAVIGADGRASRVAADGAVTLHDPDLAELELDPEEMVLSARRGRSQPALVSPFDESRLVGEEGWVRAADDPDLHARTDGRWVLVARRGGDVRRVRGAPDRLDCEVAHLVTTEVVLQCDRRDGATLGSVDLTTGEVTMPELELHVGPRSRPIVTPFAPGGVVYAFDCEDDIEHFAGCARTGRRRFTRAPLPPSFGAGRMTAVAVAPGGRYGAAVDGGITVFDFEHATEQRAAAPAALERLSPSEFNALELDGVAGVRAFAFGRYERDASWVLDVTMGGAVTVVHHVTDPLAGWGPWALRTRDGRLYESTDGWASFRPVAWPPTGPRASIGNGRCNEHGCAFGPWRRVGWGGASGPPAPLPDDPVPPVSGSSDPTVDTEGRK